jgi:hypothetical protein
MTYQEGSPEPVYYSVATGEAVPIPNLEQIVLPVSVEAEDGDGVMTALQTVKRDDPGWGEALNRLMYIEYAALPQDPDDKKEGRWVAVAGHPVFVSR